MAIVTVRTVMTASMLAVVVVVYPRDALARVRVPFDVVDGGDDWRIMMTFDEQCGAL